MQRGDHVRSDDMPGVAFWFVEDCADHPGCDILIAVGDDYRRHMDAFGVHPLDEDEFCGGCGQIGCGWGAA